jgi:hypothetical protein
MMGDNLPEMGELELQVMLQVWADAPTTSGTDARATGPDDARQEAVGPAFKKDRGSAADAEVIQRRRPRR